MRDIQYQVVKMPGMLGSDAWQASVTLACDGISVAISRSGESANRATESLAYAIHQVQKELGDAKERF